jgi:hypothetical protein
LFVPRALKDYLATKKGYDKKKSFTGIFLGTIRTINSDVLHLIENHFQLEYTYRITRREIGWKKIQ